MQCIIMIERRSRESAMKVILAIIGIVFFPFAVALATQETPPGYEIPVDIITSNVVSGYTYVTRDGTVAGEIYVPAYDTPGFAKQIVGLDLNAVIGHISKEHDEFTELALKLAEWQFPGKLDTEAVVRLAMIHAFCTDGLKGQWPKMTTVGDATSLVGKDIEVILVHPNNIPSMAIVVYTNAQENADSFGVAMLTCATITGILEEAKRSTAP